MSRVYFFARDTGMNRGPVSALLLTTQMIFRSMTEVANDIVVVNDGCHLIASETSASPKWWTSADGLTLGVTALQNNYPPPPKKGADVRRRRLHFGTVHHSSTASRHRAASL